MAHRIPTIPYGSTTQTFNSHINDEQNYRTIFSGRFGSGKTSFLKEYFETNKANYEVFHLFPVNYQVAQNEDIFELIKYDILFKFIEKDWFDDIEPISHYLAAQSFIMQKGVGHLISILKSIEYHGINKAAEVAEKLQDIFKEYQAHYKTLNKNKFDLLNEFRISTEDKKGSIYEFDVITQYICNKIEKKKGDNSNKKEIVLIIDDLDRIDPEHIFRLLNVFSAHFDSTNERQNKFGFDKIILVCDIENIQKIFHHKYGADVDFNGYINKFYSKDFFEFDLSNEINNKLDNIISKIEQVYEERDQKILLKYFVDPIIRYLIKTRQCSIRDIEHFNETKYSKTYQIALGPSGSFPIIIIYDFLLNIYINHEMLMQRLNNCIKFQNDLQFDITFSKKITEEAISFLVRKKSNNKSSAFEFNEIPNYRFTLLNPNDTNIHPTQSNKGLKIELNDEETVLTFELTFKILKETFEEIKKSKECSPFR